jgi:hypothetical protein
MDDIVKQGMAKWPNVPAVFGWLSLDRRGNWLIKGERISNSIVAEFIGRNYERDELGRWFFQNGPQRVFISLDYTPFVIRLPGNAHPGTPPDMETHTRRAVTRVDGAWIDDAGMVLIETEHGPGLVDDRDLEPLLMCFTDARGGRLNDEMIGASIEQLQNGITTDLKFRYRGTALPVMPITAANVPAHFGFVQRPVQPAGEQECS